MAMKKCILLLLIVGCFLALTTVSAEDVNNTATNVIDNESISDLKLDINAVDNSSDSNNVSESTVKENVIPEKISVFNIDDVIYEIIVDFESQLNNIDIFKFVDDPVSFELDASKYYNKYNLGKVNQGMFRSYGNSLISVHKNVTKEEFKNDVHNFLNKNKRISITPPLFLQYMLCNGGFSMFNNYFQSEIGRALIKIADYKKL